MFGVVQEEKEEPRVRHASNHNFSKIPFRLKKILPYRLEGMKLKQLAKISNL